jgi:hypothetical protein
MDEEISQGQCDLCGEISDGSMSECNQLSCSFAHCNDILYHQVRLVLWMRLSDDGWRLRRMHAGLPGQVFQIQ